MSIQYKLAVNISRGMSTAKEPPFSEFLNHWGIQLHQSQDRTVYYTCLPQAFSGERDTHKTYWLSLFHPSWDTPSAGSMPRDRGKCHQWLQLGTHYPLRNPTIGKVTLGVCSHTGSQTRRPCAWDLMFCGHCLKINNSILEYVFCKGKLMGKGRIHQGAEAQAYIQSTLSHLPEVGSQGPIPPPSRAPGPVWTLHPCPTAEIWTRIGSGGEDQAHTPPTSQGRTFLPWIGLTTASSEGDLKEQDFLLATVLVASMPLGFHYPWWWPVCSGLKQWAHGKGRRLPQLLCPWPRVSLQLGEGGSQQSRGHMHQVTGEGDWYQ